LKKSLEQRRGNRVYYPNRSSCRRVGREHGVWFAPVAGAISPGGKGENRLKNLFDNDGPFG
jgi:hypothetical protein